MSVGFFAVFLLLVGPQGSAQPTGYRLQAEPQDAAESALRDALVRSAFAGTAGVEDLARVSTAHPGTPASGLAQLAVGLLLLDFGKAAESLPFLRHPDVARTTLPDHALLAIGRALTTTGDPAAGATALLDVAQTRPDGPLACVALSEAADALVNASRRDEAVAPLTTVAEKCVDRRAQALLALGKLQESRRDLKAAARAYDRLDAELPAAAEASDARNRLSSLASLLPAQTAEARAARDLARGLALLDAGKTLDAVHALGTVPRNYLPKSEADRLRVRLAHALLRRNRIRDAEHELSAIASGSPHEAEAAFLLARCSARRTQQVVGFESVATRFPGTVWGEEALLALANHYQKDSRPDEAVPYFRRLMTAYPDGRYTDRSTWRVAWADYRAARFEEAAQSLEHAARLRPSTLYTAGFLYWAGRARKELGQSERSAQLLVETIRRFKHTYYGRKAAETLAQSGLPAPTPPPGKAAAAIDTVPETPEPQLARARELLLIDRLDEARDELSAAPSTQRILATLAWIDWRRGRLRPAIIAMKRAFPEYIGEEGDGLPEEVWRILYPLEYSGLLLQKSVEEGLDPALVAAVICQESSFNPGAISAAGARGLMQVIPRTGRTVAQSLGVRYRTQQLYDPTVSLEFGTRYLRQMLDRFGGRVERALAAYNAGPQRVEAWTREKPDVGAEEFVESIPFTETRNYVIVILASQEQYRRIYDLPAPADPTIRPETTEVGHP